MCANPEYALLFFVGNDRSDLMEKLTTSKLCLDLSEMEHSAEINSFDCTTNCPSCTILRVLRHYLCVLGVYKKGKSVCMQRFTTALMRLVCNLVSFLCQYEKCTRTESKPSICEITQLELSTRYAVSDDVVDWKLLKIMGTYNKVAV